MEAFFSALSQKLSEGTLKDVLICLEIDDPFVIENALELSEIIESSLLTNLWIDFPPLTWLDMELQDYYIEAFKRGLSDSIKEYLSVALTYIL
jgi:hypothetical protein